MTLFIGNRYRNLARRMYQRNFTKIVRFGRSRSSRYQFLHILEGKTYLYFQKLITLFITLFLNYNTYEPIFFCSPTSKVVGSKVIFVLSAFRLRLSGEVM